MLSLLLACAKPGSVSGVVLWGPDKAPAENVRVVWVSEGEGECAKKEAITDAGGNYLIDGICPGKSYQLMMDGFWAATEAVMASESGVTRDLRLWHFPKEEGVYLTQGSEKTVLTRTTSLDTLQTSSGEKVRFPLEFPVDLPLLTRSSALVLVGAGYQIDPLLEGGAQTFVDAGLPKEVGDWFYLGIQIKKDELVSVEKGGEIQKIGENTQAIWGLQEGYYAVLMPGGLKAVLVKSVP